MTKDDVGSDLGEELIASLREGLNILDGKLVPSRFYAAPAAVDVRAIRQGLKLSQAEFSRRFSFPVATVREWEQGRRRPEQAARTLLLVIASRPEVVDEGWRPSCRRRRRDASPSSKSPAASWHGVTS